MCNYWGGLLGATMKFKPFENSKINELRSPPSRDGRLNEREGKHKISSSTV